MTGTPIQNRWEDLASLLLFVRAYPDEDLSSLRQTLNRCAHDLFAKSMLTSICLRRSKASLSLPPRTDEVHKLDFDEEEAEYYYSANNAAIEYLENASITAKPSMTSNMLARISTLRQICNLGLRYKPPAESRNGDSRNVLPCEQFSGLIASGMAICSCCSKDLSQGDELTNSELGDAEVFDSSPSWMSTCGETILCTVCVGVSQVERLSTERGCKHQPACELIAIDSSTPSESASDLSSLKLPVKLRALQKDLLDLPKDDKRWVVYPLAIRGF